jgi:DNA repair photolyase
MVWGKTQIINDNMDIVDALMPIIISASRSTDIPAFYSDWFFHRLKAGYSAWINPFNGVKSYISYTKVRLIVFWSKNPEPLLSHWDYLKQRHVRSYLHFTLNDYEGEQLETEIPPLIYRIETFKRFVDKAGFGKIIWRFDPLILTDTISMEDLLHKVEYIGNQLYGYTEKLVFSFAKIENYYKVKYNLKKNNIHYRDFSREDIHFFASELCKLNKKWKYTLSTCSEAMDLSQYDVQPNKCIDDDLIIKYFSDDKVLMDFLGTKILTPDLFHTETTVLNTKNNKDKGQRPYCGCIVSKDIGQYNTCPHGCVYCYANGSAEKAKANFSKHSENMFSEMVVGE